MGKKTIIALGLVTVLICSCSDSGSKGGADDTSDSSSASQSDTTSASAVDTDSMGDTGTGSTSDAGTGDTATGTVTDVWDTGTGVDSDALTMIDVTNDVTVSNIRRLGINMGGDNYWESVLKKNRIKGGGFEGVMFRHIARGPGGDDHSFYDWNDYDGAAGADELSSRTWLDVVTGADAWLLAGDRAYSADVIQSVEHAVLPGREDEGERLRFVLADTGAVVGVSGGETLNEVGMLIEKVEDELGFVGQHGGPVWTFASDGATITSLTGDVPPGRPGKVVASLAAPGSEEAKLMFPLVPADMVDANGTWHVSFWARGDGQLTVGYGPWGTPREPAAVALTGEWQYFDNVEMNVAGYDSDALNLHLTATGGTVLLDEVAAYREGDENPTPFRDELVNLLKQLRPGSLRYLFMGGSSVANMLKPDSERMAVSFRREIPPDPSIPWPGHPNTNGTAAIIDYNMHDFLTLAEAVGADPWYTVSGTILPEEMDLLMDYLAGPTTTTGGQIRASLGRQAPWVDAFNKIHIEMGNEAWNWASPYAYGGWNGPEYWTTVFNRARQRLSDLSQSENAFMFHIGAQNYNTWLGQQLVADHGAAADGYSIAPYVIHEMDASQDNWSDEQLFAWIYAWVWHLNTGATDGTMQANRDMIDAQGMSHLEFSVYEVNHHITGGTASQDVRNRITASLGGALNIINHMLLMVSRFEVRTQNFFSLFQHDYDGVRLWGSVLSAREGQERFRPTFQTLLLANQVLNGDMVAVNLSGVNPSWQTEFEYNDDTIQTDVPYIHAYATRNGSERGLILLNLHRTDPLPVQINLPAAAADSATMWTLTADSITANNELEHDPQVQIDAGLLPGFASGFQRNLPAHSMTVIKWTE
jgi:alpha-L-arabinofuranosidase